MGVGDFDDNGYDDLIAGVPGEGDEVFLSADETNTGAVNVIYGSVNGLEATQLRPGGFWWQDSESIEGKSEKWDHFGFSVVAGDFDGNGYDDMATGVPWEDRDDEVVNTGVVNVIFGGSSGLQASGDQLVHQNTSGEWVAGAVQVLGDLQDNDSFGCWLAAGPLDDDAYEDLVVMVNDGPEIAFNVVFGAASGLTEERNTHWTCAGLAGCSTSSEFLNRPSAHAPVTDGIYTDPPGTGEWSDVLPLAFSIGADGPVAVDPTDTGSVDSVFFATLGPEPDPEVAHINLLFDLTLRTDTEVHWYDPVATIRFPAKIPGAPEGNIIGVHLLGSGPGIPAWPPSAWLDLDGNGEPDDTTGGSEPNVPASSLGIEVAAAFAPSPYESTAHLVIEMRMPLSIPAGFPDPSGPLASVPNGPGGVYTPSPGLWTVEYQRTLAPDWIWEVGAMGLVEIEPDGAARGEGDVTIDRVVGVELLDDLGDGNGVTRFAILSTGYFDARTLFSVKAVNADDPGQSAWYTDLYAQHVNGDAFEDQVVEFASADLLANEIVTANGTEVMLIGENTSESVGGTVSGLTLPIAGFVPDGDFQVPGFALTIKKAGSGNLKLTWGDSCEQADTDYAIYEGALGAPGSHRPVVCSTGGSTTTQILPGPNDHYYLVVPLGPDGVEGSYGVTSWGEQRPQGSPLAGDPVDAAACMPQSISQSCGL